MITLRHPQGTVTIDETANGKRRIQIYGASSSTPVSSFETSYPVDLISLMLQTRGPSYVYDEINRDEDYYYMEDRLILSISAYVSLDEFRDKKLLDFGCGSGASTMILSRNFQHTEIVGVDLCCDLIKVAKARAVYNRVGDRVRFLVAPDPVMLPIKMGAFDFIILNAVYEHLLPDERKTLLPQLWKILEPGGLLLINETPHRFCPIEFHTTGLPLVNYLPDRMAFVLVRRYCKGVALSKSWKGLLRNGIRGATEHEILRIIRKGGGKPVLLLPTQFGYKDRIDMWYVPPKDDSCVSSNIRAGATNGIIEYRFAHRLSRSRLLRFILKCLLRTTGIAFLHSITLAIQKESDTAVSFVSVNTTGA